MYKILTILLLISLTSISQVSNTFSKYDSELMKETNILRKSYYDIHDIIKNSVSHLDLLLKEKNVILSNDFSSTY